MEGGGFSDIRISSQLVADDVVLLASSGHDLQHVLRLSSVECEAAGTRISTFKSETTVLNPKRVECFFWVRNTLLPQVMKFKCL